MKPELTIVNSLLKLGIRRSFVNKHSLISLQSRNYHAGMSSNSPLLLSSASSTLCNNCSQSQKRYYSISTNSSQTKAQSIEQKEEESKSPSMSLDLIHHLERTSLVDFGDEEAIVRLQEAIKFADVLFEVDTTGVKPLDTVLENETLYLRQDEATPTSRSDILMNASVVCEDYFVAPPGNIPLDSTLLKSSTSDTKS